MAEACKELGPEAMQWAEQAEVDGCDNPLNGFTLHYPPNSYNATAAYDTFGYSQVYTNDNSLASYMSTQYYDATMAFDPVQEYNYSSAPDNSQVQFNLGYEQSQNIGNFPSHDLGQPVYAPTSHQHQQPGTPTTQYQYHPTTSFPRQKRSNVLENAVTKELQYDGSRVDLPAEGAHAVFTDHQGRETRVNLGERQGRYLLAELVLLIIDLLAKYWPFKQKKRLSTNGWYIINHPADI